MSNVDQALFNELEQATGAWSDALGIAQPSKAQIAAWSQMYAGQNPLAVQFGTETQNIGYYSALAHRSGNSAQITQAAMQDPRWNQLDAQGREMLRSLYNLKAMGYGGDIGQFTPLPAQTPGPTGDVGIGAAPTGGMTSTQTDAWTQLQQTLQAYGFSGADLSALTDWAKQQILAGNSAQQIALNLQQTPQFEARFPAIAELASKGVAITPAQYIALEQQYASLEQAAGLPPNFASYDQLIANQVSPSEYSDRLTKGYLAVESAPPETIKAMQDYYGVSKGQLAAYFLDPTKAEPLLLQHALSAQIGGAAATSGFTGVDQAQALRLAQMGVSYPQAQQGFQQLAQESQLYGQLPGQGQRTNFSTDQLLGAQFGSDGQTKLQLQIQGEQEKNLFNQGTGVAGTQQGLTGAGAVQR